MIKLPKGTQIDSLECPNCGRETPVKINAGGYAYFQCMKVVEHDEKGRSKKQCWTKAQFGERKTQELLKEYLEKTETENNDVQLQEQRCRKKESDLQKPNKEPENGEPENGAGHGTIQGAISEFFS